MDAQNNKNLNLFISLVTLLSLFVPFILFVLNASEEIKVQSIIIFGIIAIASIISSVIYFFYQSYRNISLGLENNKKEMLEIKRSLNYKELFNNMDVRIKVLEKLLDRKSKKGQIDPRIIWIIVMLILLYLFLKSMGILP
ncbi:MAG: hypothetical protein Q7S27_03910 [Nanoarchaeota archaeon]|nr:hypothetical protein [Nanoarchaeota archaeon]